MEASQQELSLEAVWSMVQKQQREIEDQRLQLQRLGSGTLRTYDDDPRANSQSQHVSRAGMLKAAALGVAGIAGAGVLLNKETGVALADGSEGQTDFSSATTSPTVKVENTSTGQALSTTSTSDVGVMATNNSTKPNASALYGTMANSGASSGSAGVRGYNNCAPGGFLGYGVYGSAPNGYGVVGVSTNQIGVYGGSNNFIGFYGQTYSTAANMAGVYGIVASTAPGSYSTGVRGHNNSTTGNGIGVYGSHAGTGWGVYGVSSGGYGVYGRSLSGKSSTGVYGSGVSIGVYGSGSTGGYFVSNSGTGVYGSGPTGGQFVSNTGSGVYGSGSTGGYFVSNTGSGVYGSGSTGGYFVSNTGSGVYGSSDSTADDAYAVQGVMTSSSAGTSSAGIAGFNNSTSHQGLGVYGSAAGYGSSGVFGEAPYTGVSGYASGLEGYGVYGAGRFGVYGAATSVSGYALYSQGNLYVFGNSTVTGTKSAAVRFEDGKYRLLYCMESPQAWFEDFGSAKLKNGRARVKLDTKFAQTVNTEGYRVFAMPEGSCRGLFVSEKTPTGFIIEELEGGQSNIPFSYRIVALRKDVKAPRFKVTKGPDHGSRVPTRPARRLSKGRLARPDIRLPENGAATVPSAITVVPANPPEAQVGNDVPGRDSLIVKSPLDLDKLSE